MRCRRDRIPVFLFPRSPALTYNTDMEHEFLTVQNVKDLQDGGKRWLENVLGQHLKESQQVFIMVFTPGIEPDEASRRLALCRRRCVDSGTAPSRLRRDPSASCRT